MPRPDGIERGFVRRTALVGGRIHRTMLYIPQGYSPASPMPLVVFLNGAAECGTDGIKQVAVGLGPAIVRDPDSWPMIALFPQKPTARSEWSDHDDLVMTALEGARAEYAVDPRRLYLTGISQGGAGTWSLAARHPDLWAAIAPICGYGDPRDFAPHLRGQRIWAFHGALDDVVPPEQTLRLAEAATAAGAKVRTTIYPDLAHNSWDRAYRDEHLGAWLLEHWRP